MYNNKVKHYIASLAHALINILHIHTQTHTENEPVLCEHKDLEQTQTCIPTKLPHIHKYSSHASFGDVKVPHSLPRHFLCSCLMRFSDCLRFSYVEQMPFLLSVLRHFSPKQYILLSTSQQHLLSALHAPLIALNWEELSTRVLLTAYCAIYTVHST